MAIQKITPAGEKLGWFKARGAVRRKGGLPSNVLHDEILARVALDLPEGSGQHNVPEKYYPAWARQLLIYPAKKECFQKRQDVVDYKEDKEGRKWVFPASSMPYDAVDRPGVALFVDPENVVVREKKVVVLVDREAVVILSPFPQGSGEPYYADKNTRVPLVMDEGQEDAPEIVKNLIRSLYRVSGTGVRPIARYLHYFPTDVIADHPHDHEFGVGYVDSG